MTNCIYLVRLGVIVSKEANVLHELGLDMLIKQELGKNFELLPKELESEVDGRVHDADTMRPDGVGHVANVDGVQVFVIR